MKFIKLALYVLLPLIGYSQTKTVPNYNLKILEPNSNYYEITNLVKPLLIQNSNNAVTKTDHKNAEKAIKQFGRWQTYWKDRMLPDGSFYNGGGSDALANIKPNSPFKTITNISSKSQMLHWEQVGSTTRPNEHGYVAYPGQGLVLSIKTLGGTKAIVGTSNGGIWKTDDITVANPDWLPKTDFLSRIGITDIKIANATTVYALTGDRDSETRSKSIGVIKSTDEGDTWSTTSLVLDPTQINYISNLGMQPNNTNKMLYAVKTMNGNFQYVTNDGWATHQTYTHSIPYANDVLYTDDFILISTIFGGIFKSIDDGANFTKIYSNNEGVGNLVLRFNQNTINGDVYFLAAKTNEAKVYKLTTTDILNATTVISATPIGTSVTTYNPQGLYNIGFGVSAVDPNRIFVLGVNGWYTKDGGTTWVNKLDAYNSQSSGETYVHPDHHYAMHIADSKWWVTHDGGVHEVDMLNYDSSTGPAVVVDKTNNLQIGQIYHSAIVPTNTNFSDAVLGLQDNDGMSKSPNTQGGEWVAVQAGDGTAAAIDPANPLIRFVGGTHGALYRTTTAYQGSSNDQTQVLPPNSSAPFVCKVMVHNTNSTWVFSGYDTCAISYNGGQTFTYMTQAYPLGATQDFDFFSSRLAIIGATGQSFFSFDSTLGVFSGMQTINTPTGINSNFNSICVSSNTNMTYASLSGYADGKKVYRSTDNGTTWTNISYDLPNVVIKKVVNKVVNLGSIDEVLFVATEVGVFYKLGTTSVNWIKLGTNLPNVTVTDMSINYTQDKLYAATFGRSFWSIDISSLTNALNTTSGEVMEALKVYPVPSSNSKEVFVKLPSSISTLEYSIYNYLGGELSNGTITVSNNKLNTKALSSGAYLVVFEMDNTQISKKIIIN